MHTKKNTIFKLLLLFSLLALILAKSNFISSPLRAGLIDASSLPLKGLAAFRDAVRRTIPFAGLRQDNKILRARIDLLRRRVEEMKGLGYENDRLRALVDFKKSVPYKAIPAQVIGRDPSNWSNSIIIDKGTYSGVGENGAVISMRGLVGRVLEAGRHSAKIMLITDPGSRVAAAIQRNRQGGILTGRPDGKCKMIYIALDSDAAKGDKVVTAGVGSVFPKDILIGEIVAVGKEPGRLYKYAIVKTSEDMAKLEEVLCIR